MLSKLWLKFLHSSWLYFLTAFLELRAIVSCGPYNFLDWSSGSNYSSVVIYISGFARQSFHVKLATAPRVCLMPLFSFTVKDLFHTFFLCLLFYLATAEKTLFFYFYFYFFCFKVYCWPCTHKESCHKALFFLYFLLKVTFFHFDWRFQVNSVDWMWLNKV